MFQKSAILGKLNDDWFTLKKKKWFIDLCVMGENTYLSVGNNSNKYLEKTSRSLHIYIFAPSVHFSLLNNYVHNAEFEFVLSIDDHRTSIR